MKKAIAVILIALFALATISIPRTVSQRPPDSDILGLLGYLLGAVVFPFAGLFFSVRWYLNLSGHTHKTSTEAWLYILRPYAVLGILVAVFLVATPPRATMLGVSQTAFCAWTIFASTKWLRHARAVEGVGSTAIASLAKGPLNPFPYVLVVLVTLLLTIGFIRYYNALPRVRRERADRELKEIPFYLTISEVDPQTYQKILTITVDGIEKGQSMDAIVSRLGPLVSDVLPKYVGTASDESVIALINVVVHRVEVLHNTHSDACYYYLFPNENGAPPVTSYSDDKTNKDSLAAMNSIVQAAVHSPQSPPDAAKAEALLIPVSKRLRNNYGNSVRLLTKKPVDSTGRQKVCDISISLYRDIESFPRKEDASLLLRHLLSGQTSEAEAR